ncbi:MAG: type I-G CRISPR-associated protein, Cas3-extension family, partial [Polyangiaceae bacterium]
TWAVERRPRIFGSFGEDDVRILPSDFHEALGSAQQGDAPDAELAAFLVGLAADGAKDKSKGLVKPTPFYMASGQQNFLDTMRKLLDVAKSGDVWGEALFGPWAYGTQEWGAGWDPGTERMHALRYKAPTRDKTACVAGAVCLAFEALPLFPSFSVHGHVKTVGWREHDYLDHWRWALPAVPTSVGSLQLLLAATEVAGSKDRERRLPLREGIGAVYESARHEFGQGYGVFRPARRLW